MSVRFSEIIKPFRGDGVQDVETWLRKVELVGKLQKVDDMASFLPLFLEGAAFAVYEQLPDASKDDWRKLRSALVGAFACNRFQAFAQFCSRSLTVGESVDVFLSDLRRLASLAHTTDEEIVKNRFVLGLPPATSQQLRALANVDDLPLSALIHRARLLVVDAPPSACAAVTRPYPNASGPCWTCGRMGHLARKCRSGNDGGASSQEPALSPQ